MLERDETKHISCNYIGHEDECPTDCSRCAIAIKTDGDAAIAKEQIDSAIKLYKKAVFIEPRFAEAWVNLGNAYGMKSEYNNALAAFDKAIFVDSAYGKALLGKAITLRNLGRTDEAAELVGLILSIYPDADEVQKLKATLGPVVVPINKAVDEMTQQAYNILKENNLLALGGKVVSEKDILCQADFSSRVLRFCYKRYSSFGLNKVYSESVLTAFYGSLCTTLFYYVDKTGFDGVHPFDYLVNHSDIEDTETAAERLLAIRDDKNACSKLWDMIYAYVAFVSEIIEQVPEEDKESAAQDATESAYTMGMMYAMKWHERQANPNSFSNLKERFERVISSAQMPKQNESIIPGLRSERIPPRHIAIRLTCNQCEQQTRHMILDEEEMLFDNYRSLANEFAQLGFETSVSFNCSECARKKQMVNALGLPENFLFSISSTDGQRTATSHPAFWCYRDAEYRTALAFLEGADSVDALEATAKTNFSPKEYIKHIQMVLGGLIDD